MSYDYEYKKIKFKSDKDAILAFNIVYGQVSEMIMEINGFRHYKIRYGYSTQNKFLLSKIANLFEIIFSIIDNQNIDINTEYKKMIKNANVFLKRYSKNTDYFPIVDVHATWLVLNPIQGCPKKCRYCFLRERGLNQVKPNILLSPEEATKKLIKSKFYSKDIPLCLISQSDAFSTNENIEYVMQLIDNLKEKKVNNPIIFITKCHIPEYFIKFIDKYEKLGQKFIFFLSYSGLDNTVEIGVNKEVIKTNFINLAKYNKKIIHYWRPFIKDNSTKEKIEEVYNFVKKYSLASVAIGLKTTDDIIDNIEWDKLHQNRKKALNSDNVWNKFAYDYVWKELKEKDEYPLFQTTSCALGYALSKPDRKFFYNTEICLKCNKCPKEQRKRCQIKHETYKIPNRKYVLKLLKKIDRVVGIDQIEIKDRLVIINDITLNFNEISFLTDSLETKVITRKNKDDYYWNTSINNAKILKL